VNKEKKLYENEVGRDPNIKIVESIVASLTSSARVAILSKSGLSDNEKNIYHRGTEGTEKKRYIYHAYNSTFFE